MLHHCNLRQLGTGTPIHLPIVTSDTCGQLLDHWTSPQFWKYSLHSSQICLSYNSRLDADLSRVEIAITPHRPPPTPLPTHVEVPARILCDSQSTRMPVDSHGVLAGIGINPVMMSRCSLVLIVRATDRVAILGPRLFLLVATRIERSAIMLLPK